MVNCHVFLNFFNCNGWSLKLSTNLGLLVFKYIFKPGAQGRRLRVPGFLKLLWFVHWYVCVSVCLSVCPPPRTLITSDVIWYSDVTI